MQILPSQKNIKKGTVAAIAEIQCSKDYLLYVFKGSLSPHDILLKYKSSKNKRLRTPKHIHWSVDLLLKKSALPSLTNNFLNELSSFWMNCSLLSENSLDSIESVIQSAISSISLDIYSELNDFGEYPVDFLFVLMCLLAVQEKTNAAYISTTAHMFKDVLEELMKQELDIFKIMSTASHNGR